jgi:PAS domain S-box-containing protein
MNLLNFFYSIKLKLIINVILIHIIMMSFVVWDLNSRQSEFMQKQLSNKGHELSALIAKNASHILLNNDLVALDELLFDMRKVDDLHMVFIVDNLARVRASSEKEYFNQILSDEISKDLFEQIESSKNIFIQETHSNIIDTYHKIVINKQTVGYVRVMLDNSSLQNELQAMTNKGYLYILMAIIFGGLFAFITVGKISSKLSQIEEAADEISKQNFNITLSNDSGNDELSKVTRAFHIMSSSIQHHIEEVEQSKKIFEDIFNVIPANVFWKDRQLNYVWANNLFLKGAGISKIEDIIGKNDYELVWAKYAKEYQADDELVIVSKTPKINFEEKLIVSDGSEKILLTSKVPMINAKGNCLGVIGIFFDITQQRENEKILQQKDNLLAEQAKLASMGEMIGNIAHQWRQPLSVISATASGISFKQELGMLSNEMIETGMEEIVHQANYLSQTIDDFRNFIKGEATQEDFSVTSLINKTLSIANPSLKNNYIDVVVKIDEDVTLKGYEHELMQALINILNNAKDALMQNNTIETKYVFIEVKKVENRCQIAIKDNGGGVDPLILNRIFEPYFTTKHQSVGTGLGLSMTHKIITQMHKGTIVASNNTYEYDGKEYTGAVFTITLEIV